jgi:hypothetical protein
MTKKTGEISGTIVELMRRAQSGDRAAFDELSRRAETDGQPADRYHADWSHFALLSALQARVGGRNLMARAGVEGDLAEATASLTEPTDGVVERLIVERAAVAIVEGRRAEIDHLKVSADTQYHPATVEMYERRRDRSIRRTLSLLKCLCDVRRLNRRVVQVDIGNESGKANSNVTATPMQPLNRD